MLTAATLYEAVAAAFSALRGHEWSGEIGKGLTEVTVRVRQPEVTHSVRIKDFENWLNRQGRTPAEVVLESRLRQSSTLTSSEWATSLSSWIVTVQAGKGIEEL